MPYVNAELNLCHVFIGSLISERLNISRKHARQCIWALTKAKAVCIIIGGRQFYGDEPLCCRLQNNDFRPVAYCSVIWFGHDKVLVTKQKLPLPHDRKLTYCHGGEDITYIPAVSIFVECNGADPRIDSETGRIHSIIYWNNNIHA